MDNTITLIYNKSNTFGLQQDATLLRKVLGTTYQIRESDPLEPAAPCGIAIHLEVPSYSAMALASVNILVINPEWWEEGWNPYLSKADLLVFKCDADMKRFLGAGNSVCNTAAIVIPWSSPLALTSFKNAIHNKTCLWLLGGSKHKREAAQHILPMWQPDWPELHVYTTTDLPPVSYGATGAPKNVTIHVKDLTVDERCSLQGNSPCHLIFSASEALGLSSLEGQAAGAFLIGNRLPTYSERFSEEKSVYLTPSTLVKYKGGVKDTFAELTVSDLNSAIEAYMASNAISVKKSQQEAFIRGFAAFRDCVKGVVERYSVTHSVPRPVKYLSDDELPNISVVTLLYNRRKFVDLAIHNLLATDYPKHKIEWVVVEDSDITEEQAADKVIKFGRESAPLSVSYIPVPSSFKIRNTIGMKRNTGIQRAQNDIILFMDDDDHYPPSSFRRRVSTLLTHSWKPAAVACTTIACYDLLKGTSAVNTPPWDLPLRQRISEATLCFYKSWWEAKGFPEVSVAEGEGFLEGRETDVVELQPQQIIVAMSHSKNSSSRRIPAGGATGQGKPSCFWGFPKEFLKWLHALVDVEIE
jgi:hypothetical protein